MLAHACISTPAVTASRVVLLQPIPSFTSLSFFPTECLRLVTFFSRLVYCEWPLRYLKVIPAHAFVRSLPFTCSRLLWLSMGDSASFLLLISSCLSIRLLRSCRETFRAWFFVLQFCILQDILLYCEVLPTHIYARLLHPLSSCWGLDSWNWCGGLFSSFISTNKAPLGHSSIVFSSSRVCEGLLTPSFCTYAALFRMSFPYWMLSERKKLFSSIFSRSSFILHRSCSSFFVLANACIKYRLWIPSWLPFNLLISSPSASIRFWTCVCETLCFSLAVHHREVQQYAQCIPDPLFVCLMFSGPAVCPMYSGSFLSPLCRFPMDSSEISTAWGTCFETSTQHYDHILRTEWNRFIVIFPYSAFQSFLRMNPHSNRLLRRQQYFSHLPQ